VGYVNISRVLSGDLGGQALIILCVFKFASWSISLGSGTSGGTLAPLFTIGGAMGAALGLAATALAPHLAIDPRLAGLIGMAAMFAGASRALLASVVFAFETMMQPAALIPLMGGCAASFLLSSLLMRFTIMTEKIARRGISVPADYAADFLSMLRVKDVASLQVVALKKSDSVPEIRKWIADALPGSEHQGFPVVDESERLLGVVTRRDLFANTVDATIGELIKRPPAVVFEDNTLREAADLMVHEAIGRLPVVSRQDPLTLVGFISRSDIMSANSRRLREARDSRQVLSWKFMRLRRRDAV